LDASELVETLNRNKDKIESIDIKVDERVEIDFSSLENEISFKKRN